MLFVCLTQNPSQVAKTISGTMLSRAAAWKRHGMPEHAKYQDRRRHNLHSRTHRARRGDHGGFAFGSHSETSERAETTEWPVARQRLRTGEYPAMRKQLVPVLLTFPALLALSAFGMPTLREDFTSFPGSTPSEWSTPWTFTTDLNPHGGAVAGIETDTPLQPGSGSYLQVSTAHADTGDFTQFASYLSREFAVSTNAPTEISFLFRIDEFSIATHGLIEIAARAAPLLPAWSVWSGHPFLGHSNWLLGDGDGNGGAQFVNTGLRATAGDVFSFNITQDTAAAKYSAKISNLSSGESYSSGLLSYIYSPGTATSALSINAFTARPGDRITYSFDSVTVARPVPDTLPGSALILMLVAVIGLRRAWRQNQG